MVEKYCRTQYKDYSDFFHNFYINAPKNFNFAFDVVDEYARISPDKSAMVWCNDLDEEHRFSFLEMSEKSSQVANMLTDLGIKKGDSVMLVVKRRYEYWFAVLALHKIGAVAIPATHLLTAKDLEYRFSAADVKMIVACNDEMLVNSIDAVTQKNGFKVKKMIVSCERDGYASFNDYNNYPKTFERVTPFNKNSDPMLVYFTSGTTGMPKMVLHNFTYPLGHIITAKFWQQLHDKSLHITVADTGWAKASWGKIYGQWIAGAALFTYDMDKFVPLKLLDKICKYRVTSFCAPPTVYRFLIKEDLSSYDFSCLEHATTAGEPLNAEVYNQFLKISGVQIREGFGQSETTPLIATYPWVEPVPGSLGKASPLYGVKLLNEQAEVCLPGDEGEIVIDTRNGNPIGLFCEYWNDDERTTSVWYDGYYHTGDIAWMDEKGYYYFVGRADDVIKSSGYRIGPFEVESALIEHPSVLECAISAVPDPVRGQIVKATVVLAKGFTPSDELVKELQDHVKKVTAPYKYPRIIEFIDELPKTVSGKIKRGEIRNRDSK